MGLSVVTVAAGGLPIVETVSGLPVTEALRGVPVTKVIGKPGLPVTFTTVGAGGGTGGTVTLDGVPVNATLSNGNLTATHSTTTTSSGARSATVRSAGKYYFEATQGQTGGNADCVCILVSTANFGNLLVNGTLCTALYHDNRIYSNSANTFKNLGSVTVPGDIIGLAVDLGTRKAWFRKNGGLWNNEAIGISDPATNTGGVTVNAAFSFGPAVGFGGDTTAGSIGDTITINCGQTAYSMTPPAGFGNWA